MSSIAGDPVAPGRSVGAPWLTVWLTDLSLLLMAMIWGVNFAVVKFATGLLDPLAFNGTRVALAAVVLMLLSLAGVSSWPRRRDILVVMALGMLGNGVYQVFFVEGLAYTRAGDAALLAAASPAFIALIGRVRGTDRIGARGWIGIALSVLGIGLVAHGTAAAQTGNASLIGDVLILCGAICWAVYTVYLEPYTHTNDGVKLTALTMTGGAIPLLIVASTRIAVAPWRTLPLSGWGALMFSGVFALVIAYQFWYRGVRVIGPTRTSMYSNLQPVFAVAFAWIVLSEVPTVWQGAGATAIISGLMLTRLGPT